LKTERGEPFAAAFFFARLYAEQAPTADCFLTANTQITPPCGMAEVQGWTIHGRNSWASIAGSEDADIARHCAVRYAHPSCGRIAESR
jgi:hypothetical protein